MYNPNFLFPLNIYCKKICWLLMTFSKKRTVIPVTVILLCILTRGLIMYSMGTSPLASLCEELTMDTLQDNPFELHYSIAYPEKMGFKNVSNNLVPFRSDYYEGSQNVWTKHAETLAQINTDSLDTENTFLYKLLSRHIDLQQKSLDFPYYENPLSCSGGVHSQLPILLSEYAFRSKEDIENYFLLLSQIPAYLTGISEYARLQEANGIALYIGSIREIQSQCLELFPEKQLQNGTHFLQTSFVNRLKPLIEQGTISEKEADSYTQKNNALLTDQLLPAYQALAASVGNLHGTSTLSGLSAYPKGKEYYALLLEANTGSCRSVEEIRDMLYKRYDMLYSTYISLLQKDSCIPNLEFSLDTPVEMLQHLYSRSQSAFPSLQVLDRDASQQVQLKTVDGILASMSAPAFYMTPPIDANDEHTIYINPDAEMESLDLYTTLAHEGFPGHLYQTVYSQTALTQTKAPLIRQLLYYGGFTEGWAVYAELYSYNFAADAFSENAAGSDLNTEALSNTLLLNRCNREIQLCLCSILDIYIHYDGAALADVKELLTTLGLNSASAENVYETICDAPANYPKYYVGYLEILNLRDKAKELWGKEYSDYRFHQWILETGGGDFGSLEWMLEQ